MVREVTALMGNVQLEVQRQSVMLRLIKLNVKAAE